MARTELELYNKAQADALLGAKQNLLTAGTGITIENDVISSTGGGGMQAHTYSSFSALVDDVYAHQGILLYGDQYIGIVSRTASYFDANINYPNNDMSPDGTMRMMSLFASPSVRVNRTATTLSTAVMTVTLTSTGGAPETVTFVTSRTTRTLNIGSFRYFYRGDMK